MSGTNDRDVNHFEIAGNVGDIQHRVTPSGLDIVNVSVATHRMSRNADTKEAKEITDWHDVVAFEKLAQDMVRGVNKGARIRVAGYLRTRAWIDQKSQAKRYKLELVATSFEMPARQFEMAPSQTVGEHDPGLGSNATYHSI